MGLSSRPKTSLRTAGIEEVWSSYLTALEADPLLVKSVTAGVILGAADLTGQAIQQAITIDTDNSSESGDESASNGVDFARFARFAFFGLVLQGPWNHFFYLLLDGALPPTPDPFTLRTLEKVGIDQFLQAPIFTVIILAFFAVVEGKGLGYARTQVSNELGGTLVKNWSVFLPATVINIAYCPPELRVLFLNCVFFGWVIYLSLFLNEDKGAEA